MTDRRYEHRDRRIIERFSDSRVRHGVIQIQIWVRIILGIMIIALIGRLAYLIYQGPRYITVGVFEGTLLTILITIVYSYEKSLGIYLSNESVSNFVTSIERQKNVWLYSTILIGIYLILKAVIFS